MHTTLVMLSCVLLLAPPALAPAVEVAPRITDREIIERLTRLEEGLKGVESSLRTEIRGVEQSLGAEIRANAEAITQLRQDMNTQIQQLREDMNAQFRRIDVQFDRIEARFGQFEARLGQLLTMMLIIVLAFAGVVASTIGFAIWDRRTMIRPFESKVREIEEALAHNRQQLHAFLETFRTLSERDERVAEVLRRFNLL